MKAPYIGGVQKHTFFPNKLYPQCFRVSFWCQFRNWNPFSLKVNIDQVLAVGGMAYFIQEIYRKYTGKSRKYPIIVLWWDVFVGNRFFCTDPLFRILSGLCDQKFDDKSPTDSPRHRPKRPKNGKNRDFCDFWLVLDGVWESQ